MGRRAAIALHLALILIGLLLYVVFVIPRWWVLTGDIPSTLATAGRLAAGIPIGLAALPVLVILRQALTPSAATPELALRLRAWSAVLHVVAGALVLLTAIVEIWLRLDVGGPYLFAVYGAAGSIAILAIAAFSLSFVAEKPPAAPKPPKPPKAEKAPKAKKIKAAKRPRGKKRAATAAETESADETAAEADTPESDADETSAEAVAPETGTANVDDSDEKVTATEADETDAAGTDITESEDAPEEPAADTADTGGLRNRRPVGKTRHRLRR